jgi:hypothetical protein
MSERIAKKSAPPSCIFPFSPTVHLEREHTIHRSRRENSGHAEATQGEVLGEEANERFVLTISTVYSSCLFPSCISLLLLSFSISMGEQSSKRNRLMEGGKDDFTVTSTYRFHGSGILISEKGKKKKCKAIPVTGHGGP